MNARSKGKPAAFDMDHLSRLPATRQIALFIPNHGDISLAEG
jgi:hypothetical protein